jgi:hypothetical protein
LEILLIVALVEEQVDQRSPEKADQLVFCLLVDGLLCVGNFGAWSRSRKMSLREQILVLRLVFRVLILSLCVAR